MQKDAVIQAESRLKRARDAVALLEKNSSYDAVDASWTDFLQAASGVYSKLEQDAKANGKNNAWYGRKKCVRKQDELLRYIHHARNAEEHGIKYITYRKPNTASIGNGEYLFTPSTRDGHGIWTVKPLNGAPPAIITAPCVKLITVHDPRFGDSFDPPTQHLGSPVEDQSPLNVARLGLEYLESLVAEAAELSG